jgi:thiamine monophosphate synthase
MHKKSLPNSITMTDVSRWQPSLAETRQLPRGVWLIVRHPDDKGIRDYSHALAPWGRERSNTLLISRSADIARQVGGVWVHLAEKQLLQPSQWRRRHHKHRFFYTAACHSYSSVRRAKKLGVQLALLSPVLATASHPMQRPLGIYAASHHARRAGFPVYALGGMTLAQLRLMKKKGFYGIAGVGLAAKR